MKTELSHVHLQITL